MLSFTLLATDQQHDMNKMDIRYKQANKEAIISLCLTLFYFIGWFAGAYFAGDTIGITGLPVWFEIACLLVPVGFIFLCYVVVKLQFKDISLEQTRDQ